MLGIIGGTLTSPLQLSTSPAKDRHNLRSKTNEPQARPQAPPPLCAQDRPVSVPAARPGNGPSTSMPARRNATQLRFPRSPSRPSRGPGADHDRLIHCGRLSRGSHPKNARLFDRVRDGARARKRASCNVLAHAVQGQNGTYCKMGSTTNRTPLVDECRPPARHPAGPGCPLRRESRMSEAGRQGG